MGEEAQLTEALEGWESNQVFVAKAGGKRSAALIVDAAHKWANLTSGAVITDELRQRVAKAIGMADVPEYGSSQQVHYDRLGKAALAAVVRHLKGTE